MDKRTFLKTAGLAGLGATLNLSSLKSAVAAVEDRDPWQVASDEAFWLKVRGDYSIKPDYIVCLEDGKRLKTLKRHLRAAYDMSPEEYRAKWNLPVDYPMVAEAYSAQRRRLAKRIGLGRKPRRRAHASIGAQS